MYILFRRWECLKKHPIISTHIKINQKDSSEQINKRKQNFDVWVNWPLLPSLRWFVPPSVALGWRQGLVWSQLTISHYGKWCHQCHKRGRCESLVSASRCYPLAMFSFESRFEIPGHSRIERNFVLWYLKCNDSWNYWSASFNTQNIHKVSWLGISDKVRASLLAR